MKNAILLILTAFILLAGCKNEQVNFKYIDLHHSVTVRDAKQLITTPKYIKLETNNKCQLAEATQIVYNKDCIYILDEVDMTNQSRILVFEKNGKFKFQLGKYGQGPQEIHNPWSFCIQDTLVYIPDQKYIHIISTNNNYIKSIKKETDLFGKIERYKDGFIFLHGYIEAKYASTVSDKGEIKEFIAPDIVYEMAPTNTDAIIKNSNSISFFSGFSDIIYTLNEANELVPKYKFRYNNMKSLWDIMPETEPTPPEMMKYMNNPNFCSTYKYFETEDLILLSSWYKKNKLANITYKDNFKRPVSFGAMVDRYSRIDYIPDFMIDNKQFCKVLNIFELKEDNKYEVSKDKALYKLVKSSTVDDNPILAIYEFKSSF